MKGRLFLLRKIARYMKDHEMMHLTNPNAPNHWKILIVLSTIAPILMLGQGILSPILPIYGQSFGVGAATVGLLTASFGIGRLVTDIPAGHLAEKVGRRNQLIIGPMIVCIGSLMCFVARSFVGLVAFRFVMGVGTAIYTTTAMTIIADIMGPKERGMAMNVYQGAVHIGAGLGPTVGGYASTLMGYRAPFLIAAIPAAVSGIWAFLSVPETRSFAITDNDLGPISSRGQPRSLFGDVRGLLRDKSFVLIAIVTFSIFFTRTGSRQTIIPLFGYNELGLTEMQIGLMLSVIAVLNIIMLYPAGVAADKIGRKAVIAPAVMVAAASLLCFASAHTFTGFLVGAVLLGIGTGLAGGTPAVYVSDIASTVSSGVAMGIYRWVGDAGYVLGPIVTGGIADVIGYRIALLTNAILLAVPSVLFTMFARETVKTHFRK